MRGNEKPISLHPLSFEEAVGAAVRVKPPKKKPDKRRTRRRKVKTKGKKKRRS